MRFSKRILSDIDLMTSYYTELARLEGIAEMAVYENDDMQSISTVIMNVIAVNRCFYNTLHLKEYLLNKSNLRLQIQNLIYLYSEMKYPFKVIVPIFTKGRDFNQLGLPKLSSFLDELESEYSGIKELWKECCKSVHPSNISYEISSAEHSLRSLKHIDYKKNKPTVVADMKRFIKERKIKVKRDMAFDEDAMYRLNILIIKLIKKQIMSYEAEINKSDWKKGFYKHSLKNVQGMLSI